MLDKVQTGRAGADGAGGGRGVSGDGGGGGEGAAGRLGPQRAGTGMGKTWVNAAQNKSEGPKDKKGEDIEQLERFYFIFLTLK